MQIYGLCSYFVARFIHDTELMNANDVMTVSHTNALYQDDYAAVAGRYDHAVFAENASELATAITETLKRVCSVRDLVQLLIHTNLLTDLLF